VTAPVFEPTPERTDAGLAYGDQQLFRRPAPISGSSLELPYAVMEWTAGGNVPDDAKTAIESIAPWDDGYINQPGLDMLPQPFAFDFNNGKITFNSSGLYHAELMVQWADTFPAGPSYVFTILDYFGNCAVASNCGDWIDGSVLTNNQDWMQNWFHSDGLWIHVQDDANDSYVHAFVGQISDGNPKFLSGASLAIVKLSTFDPLTGEFLPLPGT